MVELEEDYKTDNRDHSDSDLLLDDGLVKLYPVGAYDSQATKHERTNQSYFM